jgi:hypothetical protein
VARILYPRWAYRSDGHVFRVYHAPLRHLLYGLTMPTTIPEFNPSQSGYVDQIKTQTEAIMHLLESVVLTGDIDPRCAAIAVTHYETAAMFAVKALFVKERDNAGNQTSREPITGAEINDLIPGEPDTA